MPGIAPPCTRAGCSHPRAVHGTPDGEFYKSACRVTSCDCRQYAESQDEPEPDISPRQLVIDVPAGYIVNVQLVPVEGAPS